MQPITFQNATLVEHAAEHTPDPKQAARPRTRIPRPGKARYAILLWLLGIPIPIIIVIFLIKGCVT